MLIAVPDVADPVCGMTFPEEQAEALGAFVVERGGRRHYLCSAACRDAFAKRPDEPTRSRKPS